MSFIERVVLTVLTITAPFFLLAAVAAITPVLYWVVEKMLPMFRWWFIYWGY